MVSSVDEWWGFSDEYGWVVLDRNIPHNRPGAAQSLLFLRCKDWTHYLEDRRKWDPPYYMYEPRYMESLSNNPLAEKGKLEELKKHYRKRKQQFYVMGLKKLPMKSGHRSSHCWRCKNHVDNSYDKECNECKWIICRWCGACSSNCIAKK